MANNEYRVEAIPLLKHRLRQARAQSDQQGECETLFYLALCYDRLGEYQEALTSFQEMLPLARSLQDRDKEQVALMGSASALTHAKRYHDALPLWQAALQLTRDLADQEAETEVLANFGFAAMQAELPEQALPLLQEALVRLHDCGNRQSEANSLNTLGVVLSKLGRVDEAMEIYERALALARELGDKVEQAFHLGNIGHEYVDHLGQPQRGILYFTEALALFREEGDHEQEALTLYNLGKAYQLAGEPQRAERALKEGYPLATLLQDVELRIRILELLSDVVAKQGRIDDAVAYARQGRDAEDPRHSLNRHQEAREHARVRGDKRAEVYHLGEIATALGVLDRWAEALTTNLEAIVLYRQLADRHGEGICFVNLGTLCYFLDHYPECVACWLRGLELLSGEASADEELLHRKLEQLEQLWGIGAFNQVKAESVPFLQQVGEEDHDLQALFAPLLEVARAKDQEEDANWEEFPTLASLMQAASTANQQEHKLGKKRRRSRAEKHE